MKSLVFFSTRFYFNSWICDKD